MENIKQPTDIQVPLLSYNKKPFIMIVILVAIISGVTGYLAGMNTVRNSKIAINRPNPSQSISSAPIVNSPTPSFIPTVNPTVSDWATYTSQYWSIKYPLSWYVNRYAGKGSTEQDAVEISDVQNSPMVLVGESDIHTRVTAGIYTGQMPTDFHYADGSSGRNPTIKQFSVNGYQGIRGQNESIAGLEDTVFLSNPNGGGYATFSLIPPTQDETQAKDVFNKMLSTFHFSP